MRVVVSVAEGEDLEVGEELENLACEAEETGGVAAVVLGQIVENMGVEVLRGGGDTLWVRSMRTSMRSFLQSSMA